MDFEGFVVARQPSLPRLAFLLCGDIQLAEDVVQTALASAYRHWGRVVRADQPEAYVRRIVVTTHLERGRRRRFRETPYGLEPSGPREAMPAGDVHVVERDELVTALRALPPAQRATLVLRFYEDLDDHAIADCLGVSASTVRSNMARGLASLRRLLPSATTDDTDDCETGSRP